MTARDSVIESAEKDTSSPWRRRLLECLDVLLHPGCWLQNYSFSPELDAELTRLLDSGAPFEPYRWFEFCQPSRFEVTIGGYIVWIANHPYASFTNHGFRPRRSTILRAGRLVQAPCDTWKPNTLAVRS